MILGLFCLVGAVLALFRVFGFLGLFLEPFLFLSGFLIQDSHTPSRSLLTLSKTLYNLTLALTKLDEDS